VFIKAADNVLIGLYVMHSVKTGSTACISGKCTSGVFLGEADRYKTGNTRPLGFAWPVEVVISNFTFHEQSYPGQYVTSHLGEFSFDGR
jgi:hypothetical protein